MTRVLRKSRGIASVVGMLFMVVIFMLAIGAQVYISGLEAQSAQASEQAQQVLAEHSTESLSYATSSSGLEVTDTGPSSVQVVAMILKFQNETVYDLDSASSPSFEPATIPPSEAAEVASLVPGGTCSPGTATCASEYESIVESGTATGDSVGLVTSLGNTFWYTPGATDDSGAGSGASDYYWTQSTESTESSAFVGIPGLSFSGTAGAYYEVQVLVSYWQSSTSSPVIGFAVALTTGDTFLFCGGLYYSDPAQATTDFAPGNECTTSTGVSLGPTDNTQWSCTVSGDECAFEGTAFVYFKDSGTFQLEFSGSSSDTAYVAADSTMAVTLAS